MQLIQFNVYYTLHSNTNNNSPSNNLLVIDFMLLIQFMLIIIGGFCDRDLRRQAAATAERLWTEARRAEDQCLQRPAGIKARRADDQRWRYTYKVGTPKQVIEAP